MDVKVEEISGLTRKVTITLPTEDVQNKVEEAYAKLQKESKMKGFRRGKVPRSVIVKSYKPQVEAEVGEKLVQDTYFDIIEKQDFDRRSGKMFRYRVVAPGSRGGRIGEKVRQHNLRKRCSLPFDIRTCRASHTLCRSRPRWLKTSHTSGPGPKTW